MRTLSDGKMHTVQGYSVRGVALKFMRDEKLPLGAEIAVKERGRRGGWETYSVVKSP